MMRARRKEDYIYTMKPVTRFDKFVILTMLTCPIISLYASPIRGLNLSDIFILISIVGLVVKRGTHLRLIRLDLIYITVVLFALLNLFVTAAFIRPVEIVDILLRTMRYIVFFVLVILHEKRAELREVAFKYFRFFSITGTLLIILQNVVFRVFGYYIPGFVPFIPLSNPTGINEQIENIYVMGGRPYSFFAEPSAYAVYVAVYLAVEMFYYNNMKGIQKYYKWLLTFGLLLSGSTTAVILSAVLWVLYFKINGAKNLRKDMIFIVFLVPVAAVVLFRSSSFQSMLLRVANGSTVVDRFEGFRVLREDMPIFNIIFGHGMNDNVTAYYLSDLPRLYYYWGAVGVLFMAIILINIFRKSDKISRIILGIVMGITLGASWIWGPYLLVSGALIAGKSEHNIIEETCRELL